MLTDKIEEFEFDLLYAFERFMTFKWVDYPGGMIVTRNRICDELLQHLKVSSCIYIVTPGNHLFDLAHDGGGRAAERAMFVSDVKRLMNAVINAPSNERKPSLVILVTKYDLFKHRFNKMQAGEHPSSGNMKEYLRSCVEKVYSEVFVREKQIQYDDLSRYAR